MATYSQIRQRVKENRRWSVQHDCWIAHCKAIAGLKPSRAWNRAEGRHAVKCPADLQEGFFAALRHLQLLDDVQTLTGIK